MRLHEYEAKALFQQYGIAVPPGRHVDSAATARKLTRQLGGRAAVKAQVLAGGRGRDGGVQLVDSPDQAATVAATLLSTTIRRLRPRCVLVEQRLHPVGEFYLGITVDPTAGCPVAMASRQGGMDIEAVARDTPAAVVRQQVDPLGDLSLEAAIQVCHRAGWEPTAAARAGAVLARLYRLFVTEEALIAEINPLMEMGDGTWVAADAVVEIDESSLFRHPRWNALQHLQDPRAQAAKEQGMTFVELDGGDVGLICSGAGLGMATVDVLAAQGRDARCRAANFLETGGGITRELMANALRLVLSQEGLRAVLINIYGGINPIHEGAEGIAQVLSERSAGQRIPVIAKALGNHQEETWATLQAAGVEVVRATETEAAVAALVRRLQEETE